MTMDEHRFGNRHGISRRSNARRPSAPASGAWGGALACAVLLLLMCAPAAMAQFETPASTDIQQRVIGKILPGENGPSPQGGDQVGAFFNDQIVGLFTFQGTNPEADFSILVSGDDPATQAVEGPTFGQPVTFRYFQSSTSNTLTMTPVNSEGQDSTYIFQGEEVPDFPIQLPGFDLTPSRQLDLRFGAAGGGGGGDAGDLADFDVNGDGRVDTRDAALVLSLVSGNTFERSDVMSRADVNDDGVISTQDAIAILRAR
ncbi:MAG: dockerin type I repeat-containing protein [Phycisphaerales bacterium]